MVEFRANMDKQTLQDIAAANGIPTDGMTGQQLVDALTAYNEAEETAEDAQKGTEGNDGTEEGKDTIPDKNTAESTQDGAEGYDRFVYVGPSLPRGKLKANAVFKGTFEDVKTYLADVIENYPQVVRLIVPVSKLAAFNVRVKTPGNIAHKYYQDIVSAMNAGKKV